MPVTLTKTTRRTRGNTDLKSTTADGFISTGHIHQPQAGKGACRLCACKGFVPDSRFSLLKGKGQSMQPVPCGNCGHDIRQHA